VVLLFAALMGPLVDGKACLYCLQSPLKLCFLDLSLTDDVFTDFLVNFPLHLTQKVLIDLLLQFTNNFS
jgi:hypothetical protein